MAVPVDQELRELLEQYVCVRVVQGWGLDLTRFRFDGFLTWAVFLGNADGTIYGRYGTRSLAGQRTGETAMTLAGFKESLREGLRLHRDYTEDPAKLGPALSGKTAPDPTWRYPQEIPSMAEQFSTGDGPYIGGGEHGECIHCHMIPRAEAVSLRRAGQPVDDSVFWPYPLPREVGMRMDPERAAVVLDVDVDSPAGRAGVEAGDRIVAIDGQPILSTADIQWVLHRAGSPAELSLELDRDGGRRTARLGLASDWRLAVADWRYLNELRIADLINLRVRTVAPAEHGLPAGDLALEVYWANIWPTIYTDLADDDVIVAVDGNRAPMTVASFAAYLYQQTRPGDVLTLTYRRDGEEATVEVTLP